MEHEHKQRDPPADHNDALGGIEGPGLIRNVVEEDVWQRPRRVVRRDDHSHQKQLGCLRVNHRLIKILLAKLWHMLLSESSNIWSKNDGKQSKISSSGELKNACNKHFHSLLCQMSFF